MCEREEGREGEEEKKHPRWWLSSLPLVIVSSNHTPGPITLENFPLI